MFKIEDRIKPVLKWAGGKSHLLPQLIHSFPSRFERYVEPFMGSGACFFSLSQKVPSLLNDSNPELIDLYKTVKSQPFELMAELDRLKKKYCESFYYSLRETELKSRLKRAARTIFLNKTGYNGLYRQNLKGKFNVPFGKREKCPKLYDEENLLRASKRLSEAKLFSKDFSAILDMTGKGDFVYCDPPYEPLSKTASFNSYKKGGFSREEQERLLASAKLARKRGATVIISNSHSDYILDLYQDHTVRKVKARRAINSRGDRRHEIFEVLVEI